MASVEIYGSGARGTDQFRHRLDRPAAAKHQATAGGGEVITKRRETVMQPPACRTSQTPAAGRLVVENKGGYERPAAFNRSKERGIVGKPQISTEPYDDGTVVRNITFAGSFHHSVRDRESPMPSMTQAAKSGRGMSLRAALGSTEILLADAIAVRSHTTRAAALGSGRAATSTRADSSAREALRPARADDLVAASASNMLGKKDRTGTAFSEAMARQVARRQRGRRADRASLPSAIRCRRDSPLRRSLKCRRPRRPPQIDSEKRRRSGA